eukprot:jgi/Psemu1/262841/estExt_Genewise1Plus.C_8550018
MSAETVVASDNDNDDCSDGDDNGNGNGNQGQKTAEPDSIISNANTNDSSDSGDGSGGESSSDDEDGTDVDDSDDDSGTSTGGDGRNDGISAYEQLRIERIRRNQERLAQLGLVDDKKKMAKRRIIKKPKPRNEIDLPKRSQPKRSAKKRFSDGGLSLASASASTSSSQQQNAKEKEKVAMYSRRYRCGECRACTRVNNCQTCYYCVINQRMDSGELAAVNTRRRCLFKYCWRRLIDVDGDDKTEAETEQKSSVENTRMEVKTEDSAANATKTIDPSTATATAAAAATDIIASSNADGSNSKDHPIKSKELEMTRMEVEAQDSSMSTTKTIDPSAATTAAADDDDDDMIASSWLDEFHSFLSTIPHGAQNKVPSKKNTDSTMSQVYKLVSGEGVTYHLWPEGTYFKKGVKIRLGMDLNALHAEGVAMEKMYVDRRKGGLLRHPINKLIFYKEWLTNGKPKAPTPPPSPSITAIAAETSHRPSDDVGKDEGSGDGGGAKTVTKRFEDLVKANRIKWPSDEKEGAGASIAAEEISSTNCKPDLAPSNEAAADSLTTSQENNKEIAETVGSDDNNNMVDAEKIGGAALIAGNEGNIISNLCQENKHEKSPAERNGNGTPDNPETCKTVINTANDGGQHSNQYCNKDAVTATTIKKESNADKTKRMPESCCVCSKDDFLICCDGCGRGYHSNCHYPKLKEIPTGDWLCKDCKVIKKPASAKPSAKPSAKSTSVAPKKKVIMNKELFDGEHDDDCYICYEGGELICCDFCEKSFHCACHIPPLPCIPEGIWKCCECSALERKKMSRCGECTACVRDDCGTCKHCLDKPKFGGSYKLKQVCVHKVCPYPRLAPPASRASLTGDIPPVSSSMSGNTPSSTKKRGRHRKSIDGNALPTDSARKRGRSRPRNDIAHDAKRAKTEPMDDEMIFRFKISSLKSAYRDADSLKIFRILKEVIRDPSDYKVVDKACELLRKCAKSPDCVKKIMIFGGIEVICNAMRDFPDRYMIQAEACCTLAELLWIYPAIAKKLTHMGAIDLIVAAIFSLPNYSKVQQMGSGALGAFSYDPNCIQHIVDAGGLRAVIAAMERFPKKLVVQKEGCYFLQNVVARSADAFSAVSKSQVVPIIVEALSLAEADAEFLQSVYGLIANLALNKALKALIGKSDCICTAILALKVNDDVEVKQAACTALRNLAMDSTDNQTKISKEGGVDAIFEAIRSFPDVPALLVLSFRLIKELCINDELVAHEVAQHSRIKTILKAMEEKSDLSAIQIAVCDLIGFLVLKGKNEILAPKLAKAVITAMENHGENNELQIQACDALFELSQVPTTHLIFKKKETQELLVRAKNNFKACESDVDDIIAASKK